MSPIRLKKPPKVKQSSPKKPKSPPLNKSKWLIEVNTDRPKTNQRRKLNKVECKSLDIVNHRRQRGFQGEVLVLYTDGQRFWCYLHGAFLEIQDAVKAYMTANNLTLEAMGYAEDDPQLREPNETVVDDDDEIANNGLAIEDGSTSFQPVSDDSDGGDEPTVPNDVDVTDREQETAIGRSVCSYDHSYVRSFMREHSAKGADFSGTRCANETCNILFVDNVFGINEECFRPTSHRPLFCCPNRAARCPYALCHFCYNKVIDELE
jgi:hypothetical protein